VRGAERADDGTVRVTAEIRNAGALPAVKTCVAVDGADRAVADDAYFWLEPGETKMVVVRVQPKAGVETSGLRVSASAWNAPRAE